MSNNRTSRLDKRRLFLKCARDFTQEALKIVGKYPEEFSEYEGARACLAHALKDINKSLEV